MSVQKLKFALRIGLFRRTLLCQNSVGHGFFSNQLKQVILHVLKRLVAKLDALGERELLGPVDGIGLAAHIRFPCI
jgi:hypothetical protein